jgi:hypothetical protein
MFTIQSQDIIFVSIPSSVLVTKHAGKTITDSDCELHLCYLTEQRELTERILENVYNWKSFLLKFVD